MQHLPSAGSVLPAHLTRCPEIALSEYKSLRLATFFVLYFVSSLPQGTFSITLMPYLMENGMSLIFHQM